MEEINYLHLNILNKHVFDNDVISLNFSLRNTNKELCLISEKQTKSYSNFTAQRALISVGQNDKSNTF